MSMLYFNVWKGPHIIVWPSPPLHSISWREELKCQPDEYQEVKLRRHGLTGLILGMLPTQSSLLMSHSIVETNGFAWSITGGNSVPATELLRYRSQGHWMPFAVHRSRLINKMLFYSQQGTTYYMSSVL